MNEIDKALFGDHETAKRLTDAGVLVPCPGCGKSDTKIRYVCGDHFVACVGCDWTGPMKARNGKPASPGTPAHRF